VVREPQIRIALVIDAHDPPCGSASVNQGDSVEFTGWLGLLSVLSRWFGADDGQVRAE